MSANFNYNKWMKNKLYQGIFTSKALDGTDRMWGANMDIKFTDFDASTRYGSAPSSAFKLFPVFGNGVNGVPTQTSISKYDLDSHISDLNIVRINSASDDSASNSIASITIVAENDTSAPITVCEVALMYANSGLGSWDNSQIFMYMRETFESVTLQPNETRSFTINFM